MTVLNMDCIEGMRLMPDNSVDSIVTDPPYGIRFMGKAWDGADIDARAAKRQGFASHAPNTGPNGGHKSIAAEAGKYDLAPAAMRVFQAFSEEWAREALRVLKPGGHLLAFSSPRTYHRMACGIEDAGFELRDQIMWVFGSGFPKSLNMSKAIDKAHRRDYVLAAVELGLPIPGNNLYDWTKADHAPGDKWWTEFKSVLPPEQWGALERAVVGYSQGRRAAIHDGGQSVGTPDAITAPATDAARQWDGWGTALKPAHEPICVARKPLVGTVAANVLAHGTGAINIDACRVGWPDGVAPEIGPPQLGGPAKKLTAVPGQEGEIVERTPPSQLGRWPANLVHDGSDEVVDLFPQSAGQLADASTSDTQRAGQNVYGAMRRGRGSEPSARRLDTGSAARFFYCAKASRKDRGASNTHPTVKPTDLMRYLCRLVTPPGGIVLDPFAGSGSTGKAAKREGFLFMGFELDAEYVAIANARIEAA